MPEFARYALIMLAAGIGIPVLAALNAALGLRLGSPVAASVCLFGVAFVAAVTVYLATGASGIAAAVSAPPHLFLAGLLVAFYVLSITWVAPKFGVGNAIFFILLGQLVSATIIDHFGLFGAQVREVNLARVAGLALMAAGVLVTTRA